MNPKRWIEDKNESSALERAILRPALKVTVPSGAEQRIWTKLMVAAPLSAVVSVTSTLRLYSHLSLKRVTVYEGIVTFKTAGGNGADPTGGRGDERFAAAGDVTPWQATTASAPMSTRTTTQRM